MNDDRPTGEARRLIARERLQICPQAERERPNAVLPRRPRGGPVWPL